MFKIIEMSFVIPRDQSVSELSSFSDIASKYGFTIAHMEIGKDDHIHLLVSAPPKLSVTNIVRWLKGISA